MKIFLCTLAIVNAVCGGILTGHSNAGLYSSGTTILNNKPDCHTIYGHHSKGHHSGQFIIPSGGYSGMLHYGNGQVQLLQQHQNPVYPLTQLTNDHYGSVQSIQPEQQINTLTDLQGIHYVPHSVFVPAPIPPTLPTVESVKIVEEPSSIVQIPEVKTIRLVRGRNVQSIVDDDDDYKNIKTIHLIKKTGPIHVEEVKTLHLIHEKAPVREIKTVRVIEETSSAEHHNEPHYNEGHHNQGNFNVPHHNDIIHHHNSNQQLHTEISTQALTPSAVPQISTNIPLPERSPERPPHTAPIQNDFRTPNQSNQGQQGYEYNVPNNRFFKHRL